MGLLTESNNKNLVIEVLMGDKVSICKVVDFTLTLYENRFSCPPKTIGSIVKIRRKPSNPKVYLILCEVEVYGTPANRSTYHTNILVCMCLRVSRRSVHDCTFKGYVYII